MQRTARLPRSLFVIASALCAMASPLLASTWIVDINNGAGAHFTQLTDAVIASQPGDVILVRAGSYNPLVGGLAIHKGVTVIGQGSVWIGPWGGGNVEVSGLPAGQVLLIVNVAARDWTVANSLGSITLRESSVDRQLVVSDSSDLRVQAMHGIRSAEISNSRVEITDSTIHPLPKTYDAGQTGLTAFNASLVHLVRSSVYGGDAGVDLTSLLGKKGGAAVRITDSEMWIDGGGTATIKGGAGGYAQLCIWDGPFGEGLVIGNSTVIRSGVSVLPAISWHCGQSGPAVVLLPGGVDQVITPVAPTLDLSGTPQPGGQVLFTVHAVPGSAVRLNVGQTPQVLPAPGILVEALLIKSRSFDLGIVPPAGTVSKIINISPLNAPGFHQFAQARIVLPTGQVSRSGSSLMIVR